MKHCSYCGRGYPAGVEICMVDRQPVVWGSATVRRKRVSVVGTTHAKRNRKGVLWTLVGDTVRFKDGFGTLTLLDSHLRLETIGGSYHIPLHSVTRLEKKWWWWWLVWEGEGGWGSVVIVGWNLKTLMEEVRKKLRDERPNSGMPNAENDV